MNENNNNSIIRKLLLKWYEENKRDLPWRRTDDPYIIWISEVILQQTRVNQGYDYFMRFTGRFPDVKTLAEADQQEVLKLWQGLGYYSRARNLHSAAKDIMVRFNGKFPDNYKDILSLKGIGGYTAAAIASFSFGLPYAVLDGNVFRVLSRLYAIAVPTDTGEGKKVFSQLAQELLDKNDPGTYNQAIMELGALQCVPVSPDCSKCPLSNFCLANAQGKVSYYPVKKGKTKVKERHFNYLDIRYNSYLFLHKRTQKDIWENLYELPLIETEAETGIEELSKSEQFTNLFKNAGTINLNPIPVVLKHILSHRIIYARFYSVSVSDDSQIRKHYLRIPEEELPHYPISRLVDKYFDKQNEY